MALKSSLICPRSTNLPSKVRSFVPAPIIDGIAVVLDALGIRERYVHGPHGFDPEKGIRADVAVYFPDGPQKLYQLTQWLPVFENHPQDLKFAIVVRKMQTFEELQGKTSLPIAHVPGYADLMNLYRTSDFTAVVYVNNGVGNFQSLTVPELAHVHINHGESDKICMVSNQAKAYDRVFVAGEAAVQRHRAALSEFNEGLLVRVGRPQLDEHPTANISPSTRTTVMYAPTWAGEDEANNYTSMEVMGAKIVDAILAQKNVRLIYKPHPRIKDAADSRITDNHAKVLKAIKAAQSADPSAGHEIRETGDILALFPVTDLLVSDVSSVCLDFLYLRPESPIVLTDRRNNIDQLRIDSPISAATPVLTVSNIDNAAEIISSVIAQDENIENRKTLRDFYFDNVKAGESTSRFFDALRQAIAQHSADMQRAQALAAAGTGPKLKTTSGDAQ